MIADFIVKNVFVATELENFVINLHTYFISLFVRDTIMIISENLFFYVY